MPSGTRTSVTSLTIPLNSPLGKCLLLMSTVLALVVWEDLAIKGGITLSESSLYSTWYSGHLGLLVAEKGVTVLYGVITPVTRKKYDLCCSMGAKSSRGPEDLIENFLLVY